MPVRFCYICTHRLFRVYTTGRMFVFFLARRSRRNIVLLLRRRHETRCRCGEKTERKAHMCVCVYTTLDLCYSPHRNRWCENNVRLPITLRCAVRGKKWIKRRKRARKMVNKRRRDVRRGRGRIKNRTRTRRAVVRAMIESPSAAVCVMYPRALRVLVTVPRAFRERNDRLVVGQAIRFFNGIANSLPNKYCFASPPLPPRQYRGGYRLNPTTLY